MMNSLIHLQTFNEHQKRKFKSFQKEKQDDIDKKEEEERRKSYTSGRNFDHRYGGYDYGYDEYGEYGGYGGYGYGEDDWSPSVVSIEPGKKAVSSTASTTLSTSNIVSNNEVVKIMTQEERKKSSTDAKKRGIYEEALVDLFPGTNVRKLPEACVMINMRQVLTSMTPNKDYILDKGTQYTVTILNDNGRESLYTRQWFRIFKKYTFDIYTTPLKKYIDIDVRSLSDKSYKLAGETEEMYELTDDKGIRKEYPKLWFNLPYKIEGGRSVISKTEFIGKLHDFD